MRTRVTGNVLDIVSIPLEGAFIDNDIAIVYVVSGGAGTGSFSVAGAKSHLYKAGRTFTVSGSTGNDGTYTVLSNATFNPGPNFRTDIPVVEAVPSGVVDGVISGYGINLNDTVITNSGTPVNSTDVANKSYVDGSLSSVVLGPANLGAGTYAIDISGDASTLDGLDSTQFLRSDISDTTVGNITLEAAGTRYVSFNDTAGNSNPGLRMLTSGVFNSGALVDNVNSVGTGYLRLYKYTAVAGFAAQIQLFEDGNITIDPTGTTTNAGNLSVTGSITATGDITAFSDIRLKENIHMIDNAMEKIMLISGYTFSRKDDDSGKEYVGVIAQEVQKVLPQAVAEAEDGMLSVAYGNMVALLIQGMKEQQMQIDELKAQVRELTEEG